MCSTHKRTFYVSEAIAVLLLCAAPQPQAVAVDNPYDAYMPVEYKSADTDEDGNPIYIRNAKRWFPASGWWWSYTNWCSHYTADGNKYSHGHFSYGLPYTDTEFGRNEIVTAAKIEAFYTELIYTPAQGYTKIDEATCEYNCHGYAFGIFRSVHSGISGSDRYLSDAYDECTSYADVQYARIQAEDDRDYVRHTIEVIPVQNELGAWAIGETREKGNASPVYKRIYDPPLLTLSFLWKPE